MFIVLALALAAPVPKSKDAGLYFPVKEGAKHVMRMQLGLRTFELVTTVTVVEETTGGHRVTVESSRDGRPAMKAAYGVSDKGVVQLTSDGKECEPVTLLKLPLKAGDTWASEEPTAEGKAIKTTYTAGNAKAVEVPAGKFTTIPITAVAEYPTGTKKKQKSWYAVGVGVVRSETGYEDGSITLTQELKAFTPGK